MTKLVYRVVSGNVIGVIERPDKFDDGKPQAEQYQVKIGVLDRRRSLPKADALAVIKKLRRFVLKLFP